MGNLFFPDNSSLEELLNYVDSPSPEFRLWVGAILARVDGTQTLENILSGLVRIGHASNRQEGLCHINNISHEHKGINLSIACADIMGKPHTESFRTLDRLLHKTSKPINELDLSRLFGTISHQAIYDFVTGKIPNYLELQRIFSTRQPRNVRHLPIWGESGDYFQNTLFETQEIFPEIKHLGGILPNNQISPRLKHEIEYFWKEIAQTIRQANEWTTAYTSAKKIIHELKNRLFLIFFPHMNTLHRGFGAYGNYLFILTVLSWAKVVKNISEKRVIFKELPVLSSDYGYSGGRIDALELVEINGEKPNGWQAEAASQMTETKFTSVGRAILELKRKFGKDLTFRIVDWKFSVGDGIDQGNILQADDVVEPISKHLEQIKRYITLANLDYHLAQKSDIGQNIWDNGSPVKSGRLEYILATSEPVTHEIKMMPQEQESHFQDSLVFNFQRSKRLAKIRHLNNLVVGRMVNQLKGKKSNQTRQKDNSEKEAQLPLSADQRKNGIETVIAKYRHFFDETRIIEWIGEKNGKPIFLMHLGNLETALDKGLIGGRFDKNRGSGYISCLFHQERTPSLHVDANRGMWKCFGCGEYGFFAEDSLALQQGSDFKINFTRNAPREYRKTSKLKVPEEHHNIMCLAQDVLNKEFKNSPGQTYVQERCIDPELAYELGGGYGNEKLINVLLDNYDYDQLIFYGFIAISNRVTSQRGLCPLFAKRGMSLAQIRREVKSNSGTNWGFPYSVLHDRVTFPLILERRNTSFYGRAVWPNCGEHSKHRKLTREYTGVSHGAFNTLVLLSDYAEVRISEGVFDALSLIQLGYPATMAIIGVDNYEILESVARSDKDLAIAFDVDTNDYQTGQTNTLKIMERLKRMNYAGKLRNFTKDFIVENPGFSSLGCKDFNEYLIKTNKPA